MKEPLGRSHWWYKRSSGSELRSCSLLVESMIWSLISWIVYRVHSLGIANSKSSIILFFIFSTVGCLHRTKFKGAKKRETPLVCTQGSGKPYPQTSLAHAFMAQAFTFLFRGLKIYQILGCKTKSWRFPLFFWIQRYKKRLWI